MEKFIPYEKLSKKEKRKRDAMLRFTKPVTGGYYFAPSIERLLAL